MRRPAVVVTKARRYHYKQLEALLQEQTGCELVLAQRRSPDTEPDHVKALFSSKEEAVKAAATLRGKTGLKDGAGNSTNQALICKYSEVPVHAVRVRGLPGDVTPQQVQDHFQKHRYYAAQVTLEKAADGSDAEAIVALHSPQDAHVAVTMLSKQPFHANVSDAKSVSANVRVELASQYSEGVTVTFAGDAPADAQEQVLAALGGLSSDGASGQPAGLLPQSNSNAFVTFGSVEAAKVAHDYFVKKAHTEHALATSKVSLFPAYAVHVHGLSPETPAQAVHDALAAEGLVQPRRVDRSAILKFRRHKEIVPAMNALKKATYSGSEAEAVQFERFRQEQHGGVTEYDVYDSESAARDSRFDTFALDAVLKDYMGADPGLRMQIAKSHFERALYDAKTQADISFLLENDAPNHIKQEARELLQSTHKAKGGDSPFNVPKEVRERLFELYVQRDDMQRFTADFSEMTAMLGEADSSDPFNWSEFRLNDTPDMERLVDAQYAIEEAEAAAKGQPLRTISDKSIAEQKKEKRKLKKKENEYRERYGDEAWEVFAAEREATLQERALTAGSSGALAMDSAPEAGNAMDERNIDFDPVTRTDRDGRVWSSAILNADVVQKTMPGGRVNTHRALVVIGNMRGSAGYGMGKAQTPADAVTNALANAYRNLYHIDLFDNYGFAHDLHGKHNSCQVYIRATPKSRPMVASPFARAILNRFGISSASCKIVGRRDPYAQCKAIFNAVGKHENIDEIAKDRGRRYLDLRWVHDQGL